MYHRTEEPYGQCVDYGEEENLAVNVYTPKFLVNYTSEVNPSLTDTRRQLLLYLTRGHWVVISLTSARW